MSPKTKLITTITTLITAFSLQNPSIGLNPDTTSLLSLKNSILNDPFSILHSWNYLDLIPCSWTGIICSDDHRVIALSLPNNHLNGSIPPQLGLITTLRHLDLSGNHFSGELPSDFSTLFYNLTVLSLKGNHFSGTVPSGFGSVEVIDLSSNAFNGSLPSDLGGSGLRYLNLSWNHFSGSIPAGFAGNVPENATIDLSFNKLTGQIPGSEALSGQYPEFFSGNEDLCGKPLKNMCIIPSTLSTQPNVTSSISPAIAVIPKPVDSSPDTNSSNRAHNNGLRSGTIVGITLGDLAGVVVLLAVVLYLYQFRSKKTNDKKEETVSKDHFTTKEVVAKSKHTKCLTNCLRGENEAMSYAQTSSESEVGDDVAEEKNEGGGDGGGAVVMVDGETELEVETLLKASAYILGGSGSSIVYKAVLEDGSIFAVRRLGESGVDNRLRDFEGNVKAIAKLRHPNLVRVRGFYWASHEKLIIYDYVSNDTLATTGYKKNGTTPYHLPLSVRLKIARGLAKGLAYIHDKRFVHANIKPSNIILTQDMEPIISDLGLSLLVYGSSNYKVGSGSARYFGSKRSMGSYDGSHDLSVSGSPYISPFGNPNGSASPYQAPESLKNLKPSPKWDVYSFGIVLLELLTGKVYLDRELGQWTPSYGPEDRLWVLKLADIGLRVEIQGKEEAMMGLFKLGFSCASLVAQKRPSMKEALQILEKGHNLLFNDVWAHHGPFQKLYINQFLIN